MVIRPRKVNCFAVGLRKCQTQGATPAEPGDLQMALVLCRGVNVLLHANTTFHFGIHLTVLLAGKLVDPALVRVNPAIYISRFFLS